MAEERRWTIHEHDESVEVVPASEADALRQQAREWKVAAEIRKDLLEGARQRLGELEEALRQIDLWLNLEHGSDYFESRIRRVREVARSALEGER